MISVLLQYEIQQILGVWGHILHKSEIHFKPICSLINIKEMFLYKEVHEQLLEVVLQYSRGECSHQYADTQNNSAITLMFSRYNII